jgi:hypothetical protein
LRTELLNNGKTTLLFKMRTERTELLNNGKTTLLFKMTVKKRYC